MKPKAGMFISATSVYGVEDGTDEDLTYQTNNSEHVVGGFTKYNPYGLFDPTNESFITDPATLGQNYFHSNYIGPSNPKTYGGQWDYEPAPININDALAKKR